MTEQKEAAAIHAVYLGLGSNLGDRDANLSAALRGLSAVVTIEHVSSVYDTAPMLYADQPRFHNLVCQALTTLSPDALLQAAKEIERQLGRTSGPRYGPRVIDIDLLLYDSLIVNTPALTIPHPRMAERAFVLAPLAELAPTLTHPALGETIAELLRRAPESDVERVGPLPQF
ncbi:MAG TPA: 2-amino-4-hydroxy-6-hydroxymethyldihydropteridine diphosphokinase [Ktedonobacterales bacterium]|nr:2-amino-4-hydroxy-6-hydroxymethyldihydropteridine diphosphokinase [Ktedonobacterales bacterium]